MPKNYELTHDCLILERTKPLEYAQYGDCTLAE